MRILNEISLREYVSQVEIFYRYNIDLYRGILFYPDIGILYLFPVRRISRNIGPARLWLSKKLRYATRWWKSLFISHGPNGHSTALIQWTIISYGSLLPKRLGWFRFFSSKGWSEFSSQSTTTSLPGNWRELHCRRCRIFAPFFTKKYMTTACFRP